MKTKTIKKTLANNKVIIGALNCQGLIDKVDQTNFLQLSEDFDIFGVSETWLKTQGNNGVALPDFSFYHISRKVKKGPVRGGVGVFIRNHLKKYVKVRYDISTENFLWCKITKEYLGYFEDLYLCFVYIPPEYSSREQMIKIDHFKHLQETKSKINSENVILMGDFNARTMTISDTLHREKTDDLPADFFSSIYSERSNADLVVNNYGKKLTDLCVATKSYIVNGRTLGDLQGKLTCFEENGASTVDYAVATEQMHRYVSKFQVLEPSCSDHCPIVLELKSRNISKEKNPSITNMPARIRWNEETRLSFALKMESPDTKQSINELNELVHSSDNVDTIVEKISEIYNIDEKKTRKKA